MVGHKICFMENIANYPKIIPVTPSHPEHCWGSLRALQAVFPRLRSSMFTSLITDLATATFGDVVHSVYHKLLFPRCTVACLQVITF